MLKNMMFQNEIQTRWIPCPHCNGNTRTKIREDTRLYHHLVFCPRCKKEYLVNVEKFKVILMEESNVKTL